MNYLFKIFIFVFICSPSWSFAESSAEGNDTGLENSIRRWVAAVKAKDIKTFQELHHPSYRACVNKSSQKFFEDYFTKQMSLRVVDKFTIPQVTSYSEDDKVMYEKMMPGMFRYPVRPTHAVQFDFSFSEYDSASYFREFVKVKDEWFFVVACPTEQGLEQFHSRQKKAKETND